MIRFKTVIGGPARKNDPQTIDLLTGEAIRPCSLVAVVGNKLMKHSAAGKQTQALIITNDYLGGHDIRFNVPSGTTGIAFVCEDDVTYHVLVKGGEKLAIGDKLTSNGDGTLKKAADGDAVIFYAFEKYNVGKNAEQVRVRKA
ncbi:hypothetical protein B6D16_01020 [Gilliamella apicola]|uniref:hypothetical protein n=1 Tax=Gilliamella apicola TaxID=1196095 RepID=UPI000A34F627|nr:hypothetical protein [Gilliamella apicola]QHJ81288.1 MAG: hypothetical protein [Bacteriophage sp.]OTP97228.1 hypothetical protein B6D05_01665 [Gilliamella apicola]OTQ19285.1 hypothetical protein B6D15_02480 [Gilliamella apicola]OTQ21696.1 hypothetical protein B6D16_01020 [Gilliamella apicola]OTQ23003.1 hypothetical protein B6D04_10860 [Gilliamella apicola]